MVRMFSGAKGIKGLVPGKFQLDKSPKSLIDESIIIDYYQC